MSYLILDHLHKQFGTSTAVHEVNLAVEPGEFISFLGPSGCGKTTTLRMVAGFEQPSGGRIVMDGTDITYAPPARRRIGMVFQQYALFPNMTVADNIGFGLRVAGQSAATIRERVGEMLALIQLPELGGRYPHQLSGGQQTSGALSAPR